MKVMMLGLTWAMLGSVAYAAPNEHLQAGEWSMTAVITAPVHQSLHYLACNKGQDWAEWMMHQPAGQSCKTLTDSLSKFDVLCTESLPNGMKITTSILGDITLDKGARSYHGKIHGKNTLPGGMTSTFEETLDGVYVGECKK